MKEFLTSSVLPFWLVFAIVAAAFGLTLLYMKGGSKSSKLLVAIANARDEANRKIAERRAENQ